MVECNYQRHRCRQLTSTCESLQIVIEPNTNVATSKVYSTFSLVPYMYPEVVVVLKCLELLRRYSALQASTKSLPVIIVSSLLYSVSVRSHLFFLAARFCD